MTVAREGGYTSPVAKDRTLPNLPKGPGPGSKAVDDCCACERCECGCQAREDYEGMTISAEDRVKFDEAFDRRVRESIERLERRDQQ